MNGRWKGRRIGRAVLVRIEKPETTNPVHADALRIGRTTFEADAWALTMSGRIIALAPRRAGEDGGRAAWFALYPDEGARIQWNPDADDGDPQPLRFAA